MRSSAPVLILAPVLSALLALATPMASGSASAAGMRPTARQALAAQLASHPGGTVIGNRIRYADGTVFVAVPAGVNSVSQCGSGQFCIWTLAGYSGSFTYRTGQDVTRTIDTAVGSVYNNRARGARLYSNTGAASTCYAPQDMDSTVGSTYNASPKVYLSDTTSC